MMRFGSVLILCAVLFHVATSRNYSRRQSDEEKIREGIKKAVDELKGLTVDPNEKLLLDLLLKQIDAANRKTVLSGKQLTDIRTLIEQKKEANCKNLNDRPGRRFIEWFKKLFVKDSTTAPTTPVIANTQRTQRAEDEQLTDVLNRLVDVLEKLKTNINSAYNDSRGYYVVKVPFTVSNNNNNNKEVTDDRFKRESGEILTEEVESSIYESLNIGGCHRNNTKNTELIRPVVENLKRKRNKRDINTSIPQLSINKVSENETVDPNETNILESVVTNVTNNLLNKANTRRSYGPPNDIRTRIFAHLFDIFDDIKSKIEPNVRVKSEYNDNVAFKVGYISANLDTLGSNLMRLRADVENNARSWSDHKVLDLFDALKINHDVVLKLLDSLRFYLNVKPQYNLN